MPGDSMKSTAFTLTVTSLFQILAPGDSVFAGKLPGGKPEPIGQTKATTLSARKPLSEKDRALVVAERAIRSFYHGDVVVGCRIRAVSRESIPEKPGVKAILQISL